MQNLIEIYPLKGKGKRRNETCSHWACMGITAKPSHGEIVGLFPAVERRLDDDNELTLQIMRNDKRFVIITQDFVTG